MTANIGARLTLDMRAFSDELRDGLERAAREAGRRGEGIGRALSEGLEAGIVRASAQVRVLTTDTDALRRAAGELGDALRDEARTGLDLFGGGLADLKDRLASTVTAAGVAAGAFGLMAQQVAAAFVDLDRYRQENAALEAILRATGEQAGFTAAQLVEWADQLSVALNVPRAEILAAQQALATFDGVAGSTFTRATALALDMAAAFGGSAAAEARRLGEAIQRLSEGDVRSLERNLFQLDKTLRDQIVTLARAGQQYEAIDLLLRSLAERVGGAASARGDTVSGAFGRLANALGDARREALASTGAYDALKRLLNALADQAERTSARLREAQSRGQALAEILTSVGRAAVSPAAYLFDIGGWRTTRAQWAGTPRRPAPAPEFGTTPADEARARAAAASEGARLRREAALRAGEAAEARVRETAERARAHAAERAHQRAMREAERARQEALREELRLLEAQGRRYRQLEEVIQRLPGPLFAFPAPPSRRLGASFEVDDAFLRRVAGLDAARAVAERFREDGLRAAQAIAQAFGGSVGREVARIVGFFRGLKTGDFTGVGGPLGGALTLAAQAPNIIRDLRKGIGALGAAGGLSGLGGLLGGLGALAAPLAGITAIGAALASLARGPAKGSIAVTSGPAGIAIGGGVGGGAQKTAAISLGGTVAEQLRAIVEQLGGSLAPFAVAIGQRGDRFRVDISGAGRTKRQPGRVFDFASADEAVRFAVLDAIRDGAISGVSPTLRNALLRAPSLEAGLRDALAIRSISERLAALEDPLGTALRALDREFRALEKTLRAAGGTVAELAELERLYARQRAEVVREVTERELGTLRAFLDDLRAGPASPLSLRQQRAEAERRFLGFEQAILAGQPIDQAAFAEAGRLLLALERQLSGATEGFFQQFDRVQGLAGQAIARLEANIAAGEAELFARRTAEATQSAAETLAEIYNLQLDMLDALRARPPAEDWFDRSAAYALTRG